MMSLNIHILKHNIRNIRNIYNCGNVGIVYIERRKALLIIFSSRVRVLRDGRPTGTFLFL